MSGIENEEQSCTIVSEVEPTENVEEQFLYETSAAMTAAQSQMCWTISSGEVDAPSKGHTSTTVTVALIEEKASTAQSVVQISVKEQTFQSGSVEQVSKRQAPLVESVVQVLERQSLLMESGDKVSLTEQITLSEKIDQLSLKEDEENDVHNVLKTLPPEAGGFVQIPIEGRVLQAESGIPIPIEGGLHQAECSIPIPIEGRILEASGIQEPIDGQTSQALIEFLLEPGPTYPSNFQVPLDRRDLATTSLDLPEINVENILRGTRGRRNQSLFPKKTTKPPYMSLTRKMHMDDSKEIVDITKERKDRFRVKFEDDTESSSSSEKSLPPRSESSSPELQFQLDL